MIRTLIVARVDERMRRKSVLVVVVTADDGHDVKLTYDLEQLLGGVVDAERVLKRQVELRGASRKGRNVLL